MAPARTIKSWMRGSKSNGPLAEIPAIAVIFLLASNANPASASDDYSSTDENSSTNYVWPEKPTWKDDNSSTIPDWLSSAVTTDPVPPTWPVPLSAFSTTVTDDNASASSAFSECEAELAACNDDTACSACAPSISDETQDWTSECSDRYPGIFYYISEGQASSFCEANGATYCCLYEDNDAAEACMSNAAMVEYWKCAMDVRGCLISEMPCFNDDDIAALTESPAASPASTPAPASPAINPTATPTSPTAGSDSRDADLTPSPSTVGVEDASSHPVERFTSSPSAGPTGATIASSGASLGTVPTSGVFISCVIVGVSLSAIRELIRKPY